MTSRVNHCPYPVLLCDRPNGWPCGKCRTTIRSDDYSGRGSIGRLAPLLTPPITGEIKECLKSIRSVFQQKKQKIIKGDNGSSIYRQWGKRQLKSAIQFNSEPCGTAGGIRLKSSGQRSSAKVTLRRSLLNWIGFRDNTIRSGPPCKQKKLRKHFPEGTCGNRCINTNLFEVARRRRWRSRVSRHLNTV